MQSHARKVGPVDRVGVGPSPPAALPGRTLCGEGLDPEAESEIQSIVPHTHVSRPLCSKTALRQRSLHRQQTLLVPLGRVA